MKHLNDAINNLAGSGEQKNFKSVAAVWDYSRFGLRVMDAASDGYYIDPDIDPSLWDEEGIKVVSQGREYSRELEAIRHSWAEYTKSVYTSGLGSTPFLRDFPNFRTTQTFDTVPFHEAVVFPYPHYNPVPLITWGGYKCFVALFYHQNVEYMLGKLKAHLGALETAWEHFEAQLWENIFYRSIFRYDLEVPFALLLSYISIYRPVIAWVDSQDERYVLRLEERETDEVSGLHYVLEQGDKSHQYTKETQTRVPCGPVFDAPDNGRDDISVKVGVCPTEEAPTPNFFNTDEWFLIEISMKTSRTMGNQQLHIVIPFKCTPEEYEQHFDNHLQRMKETLRYLLVHADLILTWGQKSLDAHLKSAIAAVMTRNGSHNLGSHALGHLAGYFDEKTEAGGALVPGYENGIGKFLRYIQKRMDFMTQIATAPPTWCLSLPWTGNAGTSSSYAVLTDFEKQYCLLDTITRSDNVRLGETRKAGTSQLLFETPINPTDNEVSQMPSQPVFVGVPHGQIGAHALYSILENLLRNAAKYGKERGESPLRMTVALREAWESVAPETRRDEWLNEYFQVTVSDSNDTDESVKEEINGFLKNPILDRETAELLTGQWGIKEIKICAAYLRMIRQEEIDRSFDLWLDERAGAQPPIVEARLLNSRKIYKNVTDAQGREVLDENGDEVQESKTIGQLAYVFYVLQPKEAIVIGSSLSNSITDKERTGFQRAGFDFRAISELQERMQRHGQPLRHQFAVLHARSLNIEAWRWLAEHVSLLPCRLMICGVSAPEDVPLEVCEALKKAIIFQSEEPSFQTPDAWRRWLWETWVAGRHPGLELVGRWEVPAKASVPDIVTFVNQDDAATRELERRNALTYDHCDSPDKGGEPDSPGEVLYTSSQFHESIGGTHPAREIFKKAQEEMAANGELEVPTLVALMQLKEAAAVKIAVLDERIFDRRHDAASGTGTKYLKNSKFGKAWAKRRVYLLDHEKAEKSFKTLPLDGLEEGEFYDVLVVHQGIIDKLRDKLKQSPQEYEAGWRRLKERARFVVVDTGRGKPDTARDEGLRWLEYSNLSEAVFRGSKLDVVSLLFALRADAETALDPSHSLDGSPNLTEAG